MTPAQLAAMSDLLYAHLDAEVAEAVLADPQWPSIAVRLDAAQQRLADTPHSLPRALATVADRIDPAASYPARRLLQLLHAATAASPVMQLLAQAHDDGRSAVKPLPAPSPAGGGVQGGVP